MRKTFKYKAKINKQTEANCLEWLYLCRTLYNLCLEQRIMFWRQWRKSLSNYDQHYELPLLKREYPEFKHVNAQTLCNVINRLDKAFKAFFGRMKRGETPGFPRFKNRDRYQSFTLQQNGWKFEGRNLYITKVGRFKLFLSRPIQGRIKTVTVSRSSTGKWFVSFSCDDVPATILPEAEKQEVGIDVGLTSFLTDSEGDKVENPRFFRESEKKLRRAQRKLSRRKKGSRRRARARQQVALVHEKITNQRKDFINKVALTYLILFQTIYVEKLQITSMVKNKHLSKSISDASWGMFFQILKVKAEGAGRRVVEVNPRNTSQDCSGCGAYVPKKLSVRVHRCPACGLVMDRDENSAVNLVLRGGALRANGKLGVTRACSGIS